MDEEQLVEFFRTALPEQFGAVLHWAGDDGSLHKSVTGRPVTVSDLMVETVHFRRDWSTPEQIGYKAVTVNYSDLASCGVEPSWFMLGLGAPAGIGLDFMRRMYRGIRRAMDLWGGGFAGGDFSRCGQLVLSVSAGGYLSQEQNYWSRSGLESGDFIYCSGIPGTSAYGLHQLVGGVETAPEAVLKHLAPDPPLAVMRALRRGRVPVNGCADISDGLSTDLHHLAVESGKIILLDTDAVPVVVHPDGFSFALYGGEDFELVFASPLQIDPGQFQRKYGIHITCIGRVADRAGRAAGVVDTCGNAIAPGGYDHFKKKGGTD